MSFIIFAGVSLIVFILFAKKKTKQKPSSTRKTKQLTKQKSATPKKSTVDLPLPEQTSLISPSPTKQRKSTAINEWTSDLLLALEWKRFEEVCQEYLIMINQRAELTNIGADGGIDIKIKNQHGKVIAIGQCKAWISSITVKEVREFFGVMASEKISHGYYFATSTFTEEAIKFCVDKKIILLDKHELIKRINGLPKEKQEKLYQLATKGDYTTPTCPNCDKKMLKRTGNNSGREFWGCANYPRCKNRLHIRKVA
jgi:restriction system protein